MGKRRIYITDDALATAGADVVAAWKAAEAGGEVCPTHHLYFTGRSALCAVLTPQRQDILRLLRGSPAPSIWALAGELGRDVERVRADVIALEELGLLERSPGEGDAHEAGARDRP